MKDIRLKSVTKSYGNDKILDQFDLVIPGGSFFALLGPSGCGKTTILRLIGGFEKVDAGHIYLGDEEITHVPIHKRHVNTVFQNYALFPHLTVFENVAYSQRVKGVSDAEIRTKVLKVLKTVRLESHAHKRIDKISGGQKQRVAIARAIINEPEVLLLDEPLAALDLGLREQMLIELIDLQSKLGTTFVYVTHDQSEALTVADKMAILNADGVIEQVGTPKEIYEFPESLFVAKFVGSTNSVRGILQQNESSFSIEVADLGDFSIEIPTRKPWMRTGVEVVMSIRPEKIWISTEPAQGFSNTVKGVVEAIVYHGRSTQYSVRLANRFLMHVFEQNEEHFPRQIIDYDSVVYLSWQKENSVLLER